MEVCDKVKAIVVSLYMECRILMGARDISDVLIMIVGGRLREHMTKASKHSAGVILRAGGILPIRVANNDCQNAESRHMTTCTQPSAHTVRI